MWKKLPHLTVELRCQCFVVCQYEAGTLKPVDDVRHCVGLAGTRDAEQRLSREPVLEPIDQARYRFGLISSRLII